MLDVLASLKYYLAGAIRIVEILGQILRFLDTLVDSLVVVQSLKENNKHGT